MFYNLFVLFIKPKYPSLFGTWWVSSLFCSMCMKCKYILICEKKKKKKQIHQLYHHVGQIVAVHLHGKKQNIANVYMAMVSLN